MGNLFVKQEFCVTSDELKERIESDSVYLIDVRSSSEMGKDGSKYIRAERRINIPVLKISSAFRLSEEEFFEKYGLPKPAKDSEEIIFHCRSGHRSAIAVNSVNKLGYTKVKHLVGGYLKWEAEQKK